jgi:hypothetical protein
MGEDRLKTDGNAIDFKQPLYAFNTLKNHKGQLVYEGFDDHKIVKEVNPDVEKDDEGLKDDIREAPVFEQYVDDLNDRNLAEEQ